MPEPERVEAPPVTPEVRGEPVEGAVEAAPGPPAPEDAAPEVTVPSEAAAPEPAPEAEAESEPAPEAAAAAPPSPTPEVAPEPLPPDSGFPWLLALGTLAVAALVGALGLALRKRPAEPAALARVGPTRSTPLGVEGISSDELRLAADATGVLEQLLDQEVRARVALEERLGEASEELKVLRDRLNRLDRRRDEAH